VLLEALLLWIKYKHHVRLIDALFFELATTHVLDIVILLLAQGATSVAAYITHGVLSGGAVARIAASQLKELVISDSIEPTEAVKAAGNIRAVSIAPLIGEAISRTALEESVSSLFD